MYIYYVYIVKGTIFAKIGLYPWGILWVCLGYHLARYRVWIEKGCMKARVLSLIVAQYYKEMTMIGVWWDKIVLDC